MIAMEQYNVYIRPLHEEHAKKYQRKRRDADDEDSNPHIIYRRGVDEDLPAEDEPNSMYCGLDPGE